MTTLATLNTAGNGFWSSVRKAVNIVKLSLPYNDNNEFGELRVYFDSSWDVNNDGLIYTDSLFMDELCAYLTSQGYDASDVSYSEQGMQGDDFVSCDVESAFIASWNAKHGETLSNVDEDGWV